VSMVKRYRRIHFVGIGGIGMSGIAELLLNLGYGVSGSDLAESDVTRRLESLGARVHRGHGPENVGEADVVVYSSAVRTDNPEIVAARERGIPVIRRAEMLAELMRLKYGIAVAGAHGKTTTTSMIAAVLAHAGLDPTAVVGGKLQGLGGGAKLGQGDYLVAEADESDGSFLRLSPTVAVVTNIDREHLDHYRDLVHIQETFLEFINRIPFYGVAVLCLDDPHLPALLPRIEKRVLTYGLNPQADIQAAEIRPNGTSCVFTVSLHRTKLGEVCLPLPGLHNVLNALAATGVALELDVPFLKVQEALGSFAGVHRRFQVKAIIDEITVVDDYGHHPSEIRATLQAAKSSWGRRLLVIFQPHRYTRTHHLYEDFLTAFHEADTLFVMDIYGAGEDPIPEVSGQALCRGIRQAGHRDAHYVRDREHLVEEVMRRLAPGDVVLTLGAGDVWKLGEELIERLEHGDRPREAMG
jgi:UDP-N-acetylmuramate--alanine ligase